MTNVDPPIPIKNLTTINPVDDCTKPVSKVGQVEQNKTMPIGILGPYLSQIGPSMKRIIIVPTEANIEDVQISSSLSFKVFCTSFNKGVIENLFWRKLTPVS